MKAFSELTSRQKARMLSLLGVMVLLLVLVLIYVGAFANEQQQIQAAENVNVDGADFTPIVNLFVAGANGLLLFAECLAAGLVMMFFSLLLLVPWRCIAIRKGSSATKAELCISLGILAGFAVLSLVVGLVLTRFTMLLLILFLTFIPTVMYLLLGVLPLYLTSKRGGDKQP